MHHVLALDQGTTSCRAIVFDPSGTPVQMAQEPFEQHFPRPGLVEHDAEEIVRTQIAVAERAAADAGLAAGDIAAIGITNQRETTVAWDRTNGRPLARAIVWQDRRTADACEAIRARGLDAKISARTGLVIDAYFSATKMAWLLETVEGLRSAAESGTAVLGTIDAWLVHRLTGGAVTATDPTNAGRTMLSRIAESTWDPWLLETFGIPAACLPEIRRSAGDFGEVACGSTLDGIPIRGVAGDQQAALAGQGAFTRGEAKCTYGTGCFLLAHAGGSVPAPPPGILATPAASLDASAAFALEGSVFIGGALVQWLRDGLGIIESAAEIEPLAASVPDAGGVMLVPALAGLGAPHWDPHARGTILGLTRGTTRAHLARAALEGIAQSVADLVETMSGGDGPAIDELRVDGGATTNDLLMQLQADILGVPVMRPRTLETTALGAAMLAATGGGVWPDPPSRAANQDLDRRFDPSISDVARRAARDRWTDAVGRSRGWAAERH